MQNKKKYLIIPSVPTPNGRLHLGHIGGPYLSADILTRYLRLCGHQVLLINGTDSYESYVTIAAENEKLTPESICNHYHQLILDDLCAMQIQTDSFINPLDTRWKTSYQDWHNKIYTRLQKSGRVKNVTEVVPWDDINSRFLTGCWLKGLCPCCHSTVTGYFCEHCGAHFRPEEIIDCDDHTFKKVNNVFLQLQASVDLKGKGINHDLQKTYMNFLQNQNGLLRLTANSHWGLKHTHQSTLFNYGFMFAYFLMFGEIAGEKFGINKNAFAADSTVNTVVSFGIDNTIPFLGSILGISSACTEYKPVDYYLVNYFYYLNGSKFSTSRRHAIWVNDITAYAEPDIIRLYLSSINVRSQIGNFISRDFFHFYDQTVEWIEMLINKPLEQSSFLPISACETAFIMHVENVFLTQKQFLQAEHFHPHHVVKIIHEWLEMGKSIQQSSPSYFWWLKALALLIYPFMPTLAEYIWQSLGYKNRIELNSFALMPDVPIQSRIKNIKHIHPIQISLCKENVP